MVGCPVTISPLLEGGGEGGGVTGQKPLDVFKEGSGKKNSGHVCGEQYRHFKPKQDVFPTLNT